VLYVLAVIAAAVRHGPTFAFVSALLSALAFDFFFLSPQQHLELGHATDVEAYVAFLATALMAGLLASRLRRQAVDAARLAAEQESLRRIASLVARGASPAAVLTGMGEELDKLVGAEIALLFRRDPTNRVSLVAGAGVPIDHFPQPATPARPTSPP
jgi:two-component system sensor histidine kinase KdpD